MYAHDYRTLPIGKAPRVWVSKDGELKNTVEFPPEGTYEFADIVERMVETGYLKTESVGFIPKKWEDGDGEKAPKRTYTKQELLEISIVLVPSNPDALRNAVEDGVITAKQMKYAKGEIERNIFDAEKQEGIVNRELATWLFPITKPEETDDWIRIPVAECDVTATIDISKKEGIKALYCGKEKKVRTYMFDKREPYNWTMARAKKWVEEHKGFDEDNIEADEAGIIVQDELKGAIPYKKTPLADEGAEWDAAKEVATAEVSDLKVMCAWVGDDPELKTNYKLPHHKASGSHECVWRAVAACGAVIMGARGGANIPDADMGGVKAHIAKHYKDFDKGEPPWEKSITQEEIKDQLDYAKFLVGKEGMSDETAQLAWDVVREVMRLTGDDIPDDIAEKTGAVLNAKNRDRLNEIRNLAQQVLDSAEKPDEEPKKVAEVIVEPTMTEEQIIKIVGRTVTEVIEKAQGKVS